jgi:hypothetical protein
MLERQSTLEDISKVRAWKQARETAVAIFKRYIDRNALFQISASNQQIQEVEEQLPEAPLNLFMKLQSSTRNTLEGQHFIQFKVAPSAKYTRLLAIATVHGSRSSVFQRLAENVEMCRRLDELQNQQAQQQANAQQQARERSERDGASSEGVAACDDSSEDESLVLHRSWPGPEAATGSLEELDEEARLFNSEGAAEAGAGAGGMKVRHARSQSAARVMQAAQGHQMSASYAGALDCLSSSITSDIGDGGGGGGSSSSSSSSGSGSGGSGSGSGSGGSNSISNNSSSSGGGSRGEGSRTVPKMIARQKDPFSSSLTSSSGHLGSRNRSISALPLSSPHESSRLFASTGSLHIGAAGMSARAASSLVGSDELHRFIPAPIPGANVSGPGGRELQSAFVDRKITTSRGMVQWQVCARMRIHHAFTYSFAFAAFAFTYSFPPLLPTTHACLHSPPSNTPFLAERQDSFQRLYAQAQTSDVQQPTYTRVDGDGAVGSLAQALFPALGQWRAAIFRRQGKNV